MTKQEQRIGLALFSALIAGYAIYAYWPSRHTITISKETTYLTAPVRPDGTPDYGAAMGVYVRERAGDGAVSASGGTPLANELIPDVNEGARRPWSAEQFPSLSAWLGAHSSALSEAAALASAPSVYLPYVSADTGEVGLIAMENGELLRHYQCASDGLAARAMLKLGKGDRRAAWEDLNASLRLARHIARRRTPASLCASRLMGMRAWAPAAALVRDQSLPGDIVPVIRDDLRRLPELPGFAEFMVEERLMTLEVIMSLYRGASIRDITEFCDGGPPYAGDSSNCLDWDKLLRFVNKRFDALEEVCGKTSYAEFVDSLDAWYAGNGDCGAVGSMKRAVWLARWGGRPFRRGASLSVARSLAWMVRPQAYRLERDSMVAREVILKAAVEVRWFRENNGSFPEARSLLDGSACGEWPTDPFTGHAVQYQRMPEGRCRIWVALPEPVVDPWPARYDEPTFLSEIGITLGPENASTRHAAN